MTNNEINDNYFFSFGGTNTFSRSSRLLFVFAFASALFFSIALSFFCLLLRKYSPLSICKSTLLGVMWFSGGKGVYLDLTPFIHTHFFSLTGAFFVDALFSFLNLGRNRSQFSFLREGSYIRRLAKSPLWPTHA